MESSSPDNRQIANALTSKAPIKTKKKKKLLPYIQRSSLFWEFKLDLGEFGMERGGNFGESLVVEKGVQIAGLVSEWWRN